METLQVIVECGSDASKEEKITALGTVKYKLPMINSYVLEIPESSVRKLEDISTIKSIYQTTNITAQMFTERESINAAYAYRQGLTGRGITIAILDTGVASVADLTLPNNRILAFKDIVNGKSTPYDDNGHGTHVAGIAGGNGLRSNGKYMGIAPECNIVAVKVLDKYGRGNSADALAGIQWVLDNKEKYNIRIANLSVGTPESNNKDPLVRAVEILWDNGIVVNVAAGNNGPKPSTITSPGISRKIITVGAVDDHKEVHIWGNNLVNFSGRGPTSECIIKPDIVAPGSNIVSCLTPTPIKSEQSDTEIKVIQKHYMELSGTSMATPIVSGAIALLLQKHPDLKPDDVKYMLKESCLKLEYSQNHQGWGLIDVKKLISKEAYHVR